MKKIIAFVITLLITLSTVSFVGCSSDSIDVDDTKTQLYIGNYDGGVGKEWLDKFIVGFEKEYANYKNGDKVGVQVIPTNDKATFAGDKMLANETLPVMDQSVIFTEGVKYYDFIEKGWVAEITDIVTSTLPNETKSIEGKLTEKQQNYYKVDGKYYGLPHYNVYPGIVYDIDLFNEFGLFITDNTGNNSGSNVVFGGKQGDANLSAGPDGDLSTTYDNGLPATFDEFFALCSEMIRNCNVIPICWSINNNESYSRFLIDVMYASTQGAEQAESRYTIMPEAQASTVDVVTGFSGNEPVFGTAKLSQNKADLLNINKTKGVYYAHEFMYRLIKGDGSLKYYYSRSFESSQSKDITQNEFLKSYIDTSKVQGLDKPIAMMIEGTWWEEEATNVFDSMVTTYGETTTIDGVEKNISKEKRNLGFMPLPHPNYDTLGAPVLLDLNNSMVFVNAKATGVQLDLAKKFIQYISSEDNLKLFAQTTGVMRDYVTESVDESILPTTFSKSVYQLRENGTTVYSRIVNKASNTWYVNNMQNVDLYASMPKGSTLYHPAKSFYNDDSLTGIQYFNGMTTYLQTKI